MHPNKSGRISLKREKSILYFFLVFCINIYNFFSIYLDMKAFSSSQKNMTMYFFSTFASTQPGKYIVKRRNKKKKSFTVNPDTFL